MTSNKDNFNSGEIEKPVITRESLPDTITYLAPQLGNAALEAVLSAHDIAASPNTVRELLGLEVTEDDILPAKTASQDQPPESSTKVTGESDTTSILMAKMQHQRELGTEAYRAGIGNHGNW